VAKAEEHQQNAAGQPDSDVRYRVDRMIGRSTLSLEGFGEFFSIGKR